MKKLGRVEVRPRYISFISLPKSTVEGGKGGQRTWSPPPRSGRGLGAVRLTDPALPPADAQPHCTPLRLPPAACAGQEAATARASPPSRIRSPVLRGRGHSCGCRAPGAVACCWQPRLPCAAGCLVVPDAALHLDSWTAPSESSGTETCPFACAGLLQTWLGAVRLVLTRYRKERTGSAPARGAAWDSVSALCWIWSRAQAGGTDRLQKPLGSCMSFISMVFIVKSHNTSLSLPAGEKRKCQRWLSLLLLHRLELGAGLVPPCPRAGHLPMGQTHWCHSNPILSASHPSAQPYPFKSTP